MKTLAVIPARGGSKRIPRKNIKLFGGRPMIAWSIEAARRAACFDAVIVSTDDEEIAGVARDYGAQTPFIRPASLADDYAGTVPVIAHAAATMAGLGLAADIVCCIYATAPFVTGDLLEDAVARLIVDPGLSYALSVVEYSYPIQRALRIGAEGRASMIDPSQLTTRSQDLQPSYHDAGQFYAGKARAWIAQEPVFGQFTAPVVLPSYRVHDIDTPDDWVRAELMFKAWMEMDGRQ